MVAGLMVVATATAVALFMLRAPISGQVGVVDESRLVFQGAPQATMTGPGTCAAIVNGGGTLDLQVAGATAGSSCDVVTTLAVIGTQTLRLQDLRYAPGISSSFVAGCGFTVNPAQEVVLRFAIPAGTTAGTFPAAADAGAYGVQPGDYVDATCPRP